MDIKFLGTGGAFDYEYGNSAAVVHHANQTFLIDCGPSIYEALCRRSLADKIDYILLTHLHGDHIGSLFSLLAHRVVRSQRQTAILCPNAAFQMAIETLLRLWFADLDRYVSIVPLSAIEGLGSIDTTGKHARGVPSFAYYFSTNTELLYYSGDLGDVEVTVEFLASRKEPRITVFHEMHHQRSAAHVYYSDVMTRLAGYVVYAYHVNPTKLPSDNTVPLVSSHPDLLLGQGA